MRVCFLSIGLIVLPVAGYTHHSPRVHFDQSAVVEIEGILTDVGWRNPHVQLVVLAPDENGNEVEWLVEELSINEQLRRGVTRDEYQIGEVIRVAGFRGVRNRTAIFARNTQLADGRELVGTGAEPRWSEDLVMSRVEYREARLQATSVVPLGLFRVWSRDIEAGARPLWNETYPLTEQARVTRENWDRVLDNPYLQCQNGMPTIMDSNEPIEFVQDGSDILIRHEEQDVVRRVRMGADTPVGEPNPYGVSVGRWEGETLVVTTTNIDFPWFDQTGIPQSEALRLEERFTVDENNRYLHYSVTATDPEVFTEPVVLEKQWIWLNEEIRPYECNYERDDL